MTRMERKKSALIYGLLAVVGMVGLLVPFPGLQNSAEPTHRTIRIEASRYAFDPGIVVVNPGDQVTIELASSDVVHGLYLDGYDLAVTADPGQTRTLRFVADQPGTFRFRCSVTCGAQHPFMIGKLKVGRNALLLRGAGLSILAVFVIVGLARDESK